MKILYISPIYVPGRRANSVQAVKMCEALARLGHDVTVYSFRDESFSSSVEEFYGIKSSPKLIFKDFTPKSGRKLLPFLFRAMRELSLSSYDVVITKTSTSLLFLLSLILPRNSKLIYEFHVIPSGFRDELLIKLSSRRLSLGVTISHSIQDWASSQSFESILLQDAADTKLIASTKARAISTSLSDSKVGYFGKIDLEGAYSWKGVKTLLEATKHKSPDNPWRLHLFGSIADGEMKSISRDFGDRVIVHGHIPPGDVAPFMKAMDILVIPNSNKKKISSEYTSPLKFYEYLASGLPIVASNVPSIKLIGEKKGVYFFEPDNALDLSRKIVDALNGKKSFQRNVYSWKDRATELVLALEQSDGGG